MAEKVRKVELRDTLRNEIAFLLMGSRNLEKVDRCREGLVIEGRNDNGEKVHLVVRVIQKKALVEKADIVETLRAPSYNEVDED